MRLAVNPRQGTHVARNTHFLRLAAFAACFFWTAAAAAQSVAFINPGKSDEIYSASFLR